MAETVLAMALVAARRASAAVPARAMGSAWSVDEPSRDCVGRGGPDPGEGPPGQTDAGDAAFHRDGLGGEPGGDPAGVRRAGPAGR
jgi:hypothetical protein